MRFVTIPMTGRANFCVQVQFDIAVVKHHRQLSAAGVEVKPTQLAVVHETRHSLLASVTVTRLLSRRPAEELERALGVERVDDGGGRDRAMSVEIEITGGAAALVGGADADFLAAVAFERRLRVVELEGVVGVAEVGDFTVFHGWELELVWRNKTRPANL